MRKHLTLLAVMILVRAQLPAQQPNWVTQVSNKPFYDVRSFGAKGNGTTNDTAAIQAALTAINTAGGGELYFPKGTYKFTSTLTYPGGWLTMRGAQGTTLLPTGIATANVIEFDGSGAQSFNSIQDLQIQCELSKTDGYAIKVDTQNYFSASNLQITYCPSGLYLHDANISRVSQVNIRELEATNGVAVQIDGSSTYALRLDRVITDSSASPPPLAGIRVREAQDVIINDSHLLSCGYGILVDPGSGQTVPSLEINSSYFDNVQSHGIALVPSTGGSVVRFRCNSCWASSADLNGVYVSSTSGGTVNDASFEHGQFYLNGNYGVLVEGSGVTNVSILNSRISGNSTASSGTYAGALINASSVIFSGNRSGQISGFGNTQSYGLQVFPGSHNDYKITDNDLRGNVSAALSDGGTGLAKVIANNLGVSDSVVSTSAVNPFTLSSEDHYILSGTTALATILGGHANRTVYFTFTNGSPGGVTTGGTLPNGIAKAVSAAINDTIMCKYLVPASGWYCK